MISMTEHETSNPEIQNVQQVYQYTSHNFESMNRAIENEVEKQEVWTALYHNHRVEKAARILFYGLASICVLALTVTIIWWLLVPANYQFKSQLVDMPDSIGLNTFTDLEALSQQEKVLGPDAPFINTSFTVFHRTLTPSGEEVVTGKTYLPTALNFPDEQYCYLESANQSGVLEAKPLAIYAAGEIILETASESLINYAEQYCRFTL